MTTAPDLLTFAEAETVGHALHDHWLKLNGEAPLAREDLGWSDAVQFTIRTARGVVEQRSGDDG